MDKEMVYIFDTTLRDGEQSPGASMYPEEKLVIAKQLSELGVDIIEASAIAYLNAINRMLTTKVLNR